MLALKFYGNGKSAVEEVPKPVPEKGEVLLKVHASALCGSEKKGYFASEGKATIPGHELTGEVVETNETRILKCGDRVTVNIMDGCGECYYCQSGYPQFCKNLNYKSGGHAQYVAMPEKCCFKLPDDISYDLGVLLGGDTAGVAYRSVSRLPLHPEKLVLVNGAGPIGLGMIALLKLFGCYVVVSEPGEFRRKFAKEVAEADLVLDPIHQDIEKEVGKLTEGLGPDIVIECSGNPNAQVKSLEWVRCHGTVLFAGENYTELKIIPSVHIIHKEVNVMGAFYFTAKDFQEIVGLYRRGLKVEQLVSHRFSLTEAPKAFELFVKGETGKVILHPWD